MKKLAMPAFMGTINTTASMDKAINWVRGNGVRFDAVVTTLAVAIMQHAKDHGDCSRALRLVEAMPASARRAALIQWFGKYSPIAVTYAKEADKRRVGLRKPGTQGYNAFNIDAAREHPYYEKQVANEEAALFGLEDFNEKILRLADFADKRLKEGKVKAADATALRAKLAAVRVAATLTPKDSFEVKAAAAK